MMDPTAFDGPVADFEQTESGPLSKFTHGISKRYQMFLDRTTPHTAGRWTLTFVLLIAYCVRVFLVQGWYIVTYALGIYLLSLFVGFLTPQDDPELTGPTLPTHQDDEFRPFVRRLPEFKFWHKSTQALIIGFTMTFFEMFNIPVFWPILLIYFITLFFMTMKRQIRHMIKHKYVPFSIGKQTYGDGSGSNILPAKESK